MSRLVLVSSGIKWDIFKDWKPIKLSPSSSEVVFVEIILCLSFVLDCLLLSSSIGLTNKISWSRYSPPYFHKNPSLKNFEMIKWNSSWHTLKKYLEEKMSILSYNSYLATSLRWIDFQTERVYLKSSRHQSWSGVYSKTLSKFNESTRTFRSIPLATLLSNVSPGLECYSGRKKYDIKLSKAYVQSLIKIYYIILLFFIPLHF